MAVSVIRVPCKKFNPLFNDLQNFIHVAYSSEYSRNTLVKIIEYNRESLEDTGRYCIKTVGFIQDLHDGCMILGLSPQVDRKTLLQEVSLDKTVVRYDEIFNRNRIDNIGKK